MAEHVIRRLDRAGERQHDTALVRFRDAAGPFPEVPLDNVGLAELGAAAVEDERLAVAKLVSEHRREPQVPPLGHAARHPGRVLFLGVVVDVEVGRLHDPEFQVAVLDFVLAEVPGLGGRRRRCGRYDQSGSDRRECTSRHEALHTSKHQKCNAVASRNGRARRHPIRFGGTKSR